MVEHPMMPVSAADFARATGTLVSAYRGDPVHRWLYPDDAQYEAHFPQHVAAYDDSARVTHTTWQLDDFGAVAVWLPPGFPPDPERIGQVLRNTVDQKKHQEMFDVLEQLEERHPKYPHWYLVWFGVRAEDQDRGLGSQLLAASLDLVDDAGLPAFGEARNPRSVPFFERHGFVVTGQTESPSLPPLISLLREAR
jgi:GNAT superfamily N-acetyltransferase